MYRDQSCWTRGNYTLSITPKGKQLTTVAMVHHNKLLLNVDNLQRYINTHMLVVVNTAPYKTSPCLICSGNPSSTWIKGLGSAVSKRHLLAY